MRAELDVPSLLHHVNKPADLGIGNTYQIRKYILNLHLISFKYERIPAIINNI